MINTFYGRRQESAACLLMGYCLKLGVTILQCLLDLITFATVGTGLAHVLVIKKDVLVFRQY